MAEEGDRAGINPLVVVPASGVVLALLVGVVALIASRSDEPPRNRQAEAVATARSWLRAWATDNRKEMRRIAVDRAAGLDAVLDDFESSLQPGAIDAEVAPIPVIDGDRATVTYFADIELPGFGTWSYRGSLALADREVRVADSDDTETKWQVVFSPEPIHPALSGGRSLRLARMWAPRGALLMTDDSPLPRVMPWRSIAGTIGPATAERAAELGSYYRTDDVVGQSGLQASFERELAGTPSGEVQVVAGEDVVEVLQAFSGTPGTDVRT